VTPIGGMSPTDNLLNMNKRVAYPCYVWLHLFVGCASHFRWRTEIGVEGAEMAEFSRPSGGRSDDDRALLDRLRAGDDSAFGLLFSRHADAVRRFAMHQVRDAAEAEDLTAEAFFRVLQALRRGSGPTDHVRTYLLTVARRVSWEWSARRRDVPVEDEELSRRTEPCADNSTRLAESYLIAQAFTSLPERWRTVLWQVEVEGERPAVVAPHFGLSANATAALARRARDGLRAAYLQAHLADDRGATGCQSVRDKLGGYTAGTIKGMEGRRIKAHLKCCESCQSLQGELSEVCSSLRAHAGLLLPVIGLGITATVAPAVTGGSAVGTAVVGKSVLFATRVKLALTAGSVAAAGVFGITIGPWLSHSALAVPTPSHDQNEQTYCAPSLVRNQPDQPPAAVAGPKVAGTGQVLGATEVPRMPGGGTSGHIDREDANEGDQTAVIGGKESDDPGWRSVDDGGLRTTVTSDPDSPTTTTDPTLMAVPVTSTPPTTKPTTPARTTKPVPTQTDLTRKKPPVTTTTTTTTPLPTTESPAPTSTNEGTTGGR
jgi:RNA polymerase sigma factor (sigma-70 family)